MSRVQIKIPRSVHANGYVMGWSDLPEPRDRSTAGERLTDQLFRTIPGTEAAVIAANRLRNYVRKQPTD